MRLSESQLRKIILKEVNNLLEADEVGKAPSAQSTSKLSEQQKKQLNDLTKSSPTSLQGFSKNLKLLASIIDDIDPKSANISSSQLGQYWPQVMAVVANMVSEEKTSSSETAKVAKTLG